MIRKILFTTISFGAILYANADEYKETKDNNRFAYVKVSSKNVEESCETSISFKKEKEKVEDMRFEYHCFLNKNPIHRGMGKSTLSMEQIVNEFSLLIKHYKLAKNFKYSSNIRFFSRHNNLAEPHFLKYINEEVTWNKKLYETDSFDFYREGVRELIVKSKVYEPLIQLFNSYGYKLEVQKYFSEHLMHKGKAELMDKKILTDSEFIQKTNKEKYPFINWVGFNLHTAI